MRHFLIGFLAIIGLTITSQAIAGPHHHHGHHHRHWHHNHGWVWVAPTIIGGVIGYEIARNQQPVIVQQIPQQTQTVECTEWREVMHPDGRVVKERTCTQR